MLGARRTPLKRHRDEAEKPFWISFSDLMTALMVLFLVAMAVALMSVTQGLRKMDEGRAQRDSYRSSQKEPAIHQNLPENSSGGLLARFYATCDYRAGNLADWRPRL
jgi:hypothetical protein